MVVVLHFGLTINQAGRTSSLNAKKTPVAINQIAVTTSADLMAGARERIGVVETGERIAVVEMARRRGG
jgi:hypothetical protein